LISRCLAIIVASLCLTAGGAARAQPPSPPEADDVQRLLTRIERLVGAGDVFGYLDLVAGTANRARAVDFSRSEIQPGATRAVVKERDRTPFGSTTNPDGYRLIVDVFAEFGQRGREATWRLDVQRRGGAWEIFDAERLTVVERLYRISLDGNRQFNASNLTIAAEDVDVVFESGRLFLVVADAGATGLVLVGRGEMRFHPRPATEKGQVKIFCGSETLVAPFTAAFIRMDPSDFDRLVAVDRLTEIPVDPVDLRRAANIFKEDSTKSYHLALGDLSSDLWSLMPGSGNFVAEVHTRRFGTLTYARSKNEPEDITLFDRARHRNIALYASQETLGRRGRSYHEDDLRDYDVLDYKIDLAVSPGRQWLDGVASVRMRVKTDVMSTVQLRLAESLVVRSITSDRFGRLFGFRVKNQNIVVVNLPASLLRDTSLTLTVTYSGRLESQSIESVETVTAGLGQDQSEPPLELAAEPNYLYSNRMPWYPQALSTDYATATIKISVPPAYGCVASGVLEPGWPQLMGDKAEQTERKVYSFAAEQPLRYLAFIVSRFARVDARTVTSPPGDPADVVGERIGRSYETLALSVEANPRQVKSGQSLGERAADIAQFYASLAGDLPYPAFTIAVTEGNVPGGHSPAYFAEVVQPLPFTTLVWRDDPASFDKFPDFFIAHELAHQWFGQAVGWSNYHEQWLSEGFAQYFAALYAQHQRGDGVFAGILRHMRRWAMRESDQGPVYLGYRLGHIKNDSRVFRALVYNKGAAVLHMLRRLVGDDVFFRSVRRFYSSSRFRKVGTDDLRKAFEAEAGRPLDRFFDQWIYGSGLPRLKVQYRVEGSALAVHVDQIDGVFEVPVTLTLQYANGKKADVVIAVRDQSTDQRIPLASTLQSVVVNKDDGILAAID
jgi:Peptidase family M1 domain